MMSIAEASGDGPEKIPGPASLQMEQDRVAVFRSSRLRTTQPRVPSLPQFLHQ